MTTLLTHRFFLVRGLALVLLLFVGVFVLYGTAHAQAIDAIGSCFTEAGFGKCISSGFAGIFASLFLVFTTIFAVVMAWAASFFNFAMLVTVYQFANFFGNSDGLRLAWGILRDLANIFLLFGFILIGVMTILDIGKFTANKALPALIIFGILLNFSLFVSEAIVDVSNAFASTFYAQAGNVDCGNGRNNVECANLGIAGKVIEVSGLAATFSVSGDQFAAIWDHESGSEQQAVIHFGMMVLVIVMAGVFFAGAFILVSRAITLLFLFALSPIGFAGMAVPGFEKYANEWWGKLIDNAIFAPVYVLFLLISIKILGGVKISLGLTGDRSIYTVFLESETITLGGMLLFFALVVGFMWLSLDFARKSSVYGSKQIAGAAMGWIANTVGAVTTTPVGLFSRGIGMAYGGSTRAIRRGIGNLPGGKAFNYVAGALGGTAIDRGLRSVFEAGQGIKIPIEGAKSFKDVLKEGEEHSKALDAQDKKDKDERKRQENERNINQALRSGNPAKISGALQKMNLTDTELFVKNARAQDLESAAKHLTPERFAALMDSKEVEGKKGALFKARYKELDKAISSGDKDTIRSLNKKDLEQYIKGSPGGFQRLVEAESDPRTGEGLLSEDQMESLQKDSGSILDNGQRKMLVANTLPSRIKRELGRGAGGVGRARLWTQNMPPKTFAKLSADVLTQDALVQDYTASTLQNILRENTKLKDADFKTIGALVRDPLHRNHAGIMAYLGGNAAANATF